jgi:drebrin-like protein
MSRVEAASGAKYSAHKEQPRQIEPIAPVGTAYTPVGKIDIAALRKVPPPVPKPTLPSSSSRPAFIAIKPTVSARFLSFGIYHSSAKASGV